MAGVVTDVWPIKATEIMGWIRQRLQSKGLNADQDAVKMIAQRVEGNMLAAAQEIFARSQGTTLSEREYPSMRSTARLTIST